MLCAALFGGRLLGERDAGMRLFGAVCIAVGVIALISACWRTIWIPAFAGMTMHRGVCLISLTSVFSAPLN